MNYSDKKRGQGSSFLLQGSSDIGILFLHAWISQPEEFLPLAKFLNSLGYTVSAPRLAGHGAEPEDLKDVIWQEWLADSQKALKELKKQTSRIFVSGISMGANLAMLLSQDESVAGVIPMGAPVKLHFQELAKAGLFFMNLTKTYRRPYYPPWVSKKMSQRNTYPYYPIKSAREVLSLAEHTRSNLSKIKKPMLIMQSTSDHLVSRKSPQIIYAGIKSEIKEIYWVKDAYHVFVDDEKVHQKMSEFISRVISL
jgi:carboxylesterase